MSTPGMQHDLYAHNSALQLQAIRQAAPLLKQAAAGVARHLLAAPAAAAAGEGEGGRPPHTLLNLVDFGSSQGSNSVEAASLVVGELRARLFEGGAPGGPPPLPGDVTVVVNHNDLPSNDFRSLMTAVGRSGPHCPALQQQQQPLASAARTQQAACRAPAQLAAPTSTC
jgi:hypothetical protein